MNAALLAYWTHDLDPVAFRFPESWGLRGVHWYGLAYAAGFLVAAWLLGRWRRAGLSFWLSVAGFGFWCTGARL